MRQNDSAKGTLFNIDVVLSSAINTGETLAD